MKGAMKTFDMTAIVDRTVTDFINLTIEAETEQEAFLKARKVLDTFPEGHSEEGVLFCYIEKREYNPPDISDLVLQNEEDEGIG